MSLKSRIQDFKESKIINPHSFSDFPLITNIKFESKKYKAFERNVIRFLSKSATNSYKLKSEKQILDYYDRNQYKLKFITPNGAIVPKYETTNDFNKITRSFVNLIKSTNFYKNIIKVHVPLNIRIKFKKIPNVFLKRNMATEIPHSDAWAGEKSTCVNMHIPLFGDTANNRMEFYYPKKFKENWLRHLNHFSEGKKFLKFYQKINLITLKKEATISDFATLHKTVRKKNCGTRISLDTTFDLKRKFTKNKNNIIHKKRVNEYISLNKFLKLGTKIKFQFNQSINDDFIKNKEHQHYSNFNFIYAKN